MDAPTVAGLAAFERRATAPQGDQGVSYQRCLDMAIEIVELGTGPLSTRTVGVESVRTAIFIIAAHEFGVEQGVTGNGYRPSEDGQLVPGPGGYLIPNRAATLINQRRFDYAANVGIG